MADFIQQISTDLGVPLWLLAIALAWAAFWKVLALWKSARNNQPIWFVVIFVINTLGILEILYIFLFSKISLDKKPVKSISLKRKNTKSAKGKR